MTPLNVFIGYDPRQPVAFQVAAHSVWKHASQPVSITRLQLNQLPITRTGLTQFTYSRFLVPWLSGYEGLSLFVDSDVLVRGDVHELLSYPTEHLGMGVFLVPHTLKFERPSVMLFRNALCKTLTPEYVQQANVFNFEWAQERIGALPKEWNHLVGYDEPNPHAKLVHFTQGIPCWPETVGSEFAQDWLAMFKESAGSVSFKDLMGPSVHVPHVKKRLEQQAQA